MLEYLDLEVMKKQIKVERQQVYSISADCPAIALGLMMPYILLLVGGQTST